MCITAIFVFFLFKFWLNSLDMCRGASLFSAEDSNNPEALQAVAGA